MFQVRVIDDCNHRDDRLERGDPERVQPQLTPLASEHRKTFNSEMLQVGPNCVPTMNTMSQ